MGKGVDIILMSINEIVSSFPGIMLVLILVGFVGRGRAKHYNNIFPYWLVRRI